MFQYSLQIDRKATTASLIPICNQSFNEYSGLEAIFIQHKQESTIQGRSQVSVLGGKLHLALHCGLRWLVPINVTPQKLGTCLKIFKN